MKKRKSAVITEITALFTGPSGGSRTHGLMDPNHARYQLRYTRMCNTAIIRIFPRAVKSESGRFLKNFLFLRRAAILPQFYMTRLLHFTALRYALRCGTKNVQNQHVK